MPVIDGNFLDWTEDLRLDTSLTGWPNYSLYGTSDANNFYFSLGWTGGAIGANTTLWLDTDMNRATGYQIWGFTGGAEYNINFGTDGVPRLYFGGAGQTYVADLEYATSADGTQVELAVPKDLLSGSPDEVRVYADVNDTAFLPNDYSNDNLVVGPVQDQSPVPVGAITLDGNIADWAPETRLDTAATGTPGYGLYGDIQGDAFVFAITSQNGPIGPNTTIWLDTDLDRTTGYQIWGFTGGAEYNVNFDANGVAKLYTGGAGETFVADLEYRKSADGSTIELAVPKALLAGAPEAVRVFVDVNDSAFLPNDYANDDLIVRAPAAPQPPLTVGAITLDGSIADWAPETRLDTPATGTAGYGLYGQTQAESLVFAITSENGPIGANTTIWLDTDMNRATGYQIWGFTGGAEYNVNFDANGVAKLYTGGAGQTFVADLDYRMSADGSTVELAVAKSLLGGVTGDVRVFADVNDTAFLPNDYAGINLVVAGPRPPIQVGAITLDGDISDWTSDTRLDSAASGTPGYAFYGQTQADSFVFALTSDSGPIGPNTTIWLDTDMNRATGYQIFGVTGGAEYNVNFDSDGTAKLYTGAAGQTFVANLDYRMSADGHTVELSVAKSLLEGAPDNIRVYADVNDTAFLPNDYASNNFYVTAPPPPPSPAARIAIVYSETSANHFYDKTAYGQLVMSAQAQAMQAGIPFDLLSEADLKNVATLSQYKAIVFPGFANVQSADLDAIQSALAIAKQTYHVGLIAAGDFMTNDETGAALSGNSYARMDSLLGVTASSFGTTNGIELVADSGTNPILSGYAPGEVVGDYTNISYGAYADTTGSGQVLFDQVVSDGAGGTTHVGAVIANQTDTTRAVHFASDAIIGNNNILGSAIDWVVHGDAPDVSLALTRGSSLFNSRVDMDQSQEVSDVIDAKPGIYDQLLPILSDWYAKYGFVGSYYINIGDNPPDQMTDWVKSGKYYQKLLAMGNEIGTHSWTHPEDTNQLSDADPRLPALLALVDPRNPDAVDPSTLSAADRAILEQSFVFQFQFSALKIAQELGIDVTGAAVPGAPEKLATSLQILPYFDYISGGYSGTGAGYPNAFGFLTPDQTSKVYLAPNMSFDFSLIEFKGMTPEQATAEWLKEFAALTSHATTPIIEFPWHDYGPTDWNTGGGASISYTQAMFDAVLAAAAASGTEFVTAKDLADRIHSFSNSTLDISRSGSTVNATVTSTDAGRFALTLGEGEKIGSVDNWYAYNETKVFLPQNGGSFAINLSDTPADVTHVTSLPMRADLLAVSGNGSNLGASFSGVGDVGLHLRAQGTDTVLITGANGGSLGDSGSDVTLNYTADAAHSLSVTYQSAGRVLGTSGSDVILGGSGDDRLLGRGGNDLIVGNEGNDTIVGGGGKDMILGGNGNDSLSGGGGNDTIIGGEGNDTLSGDRGNDLLTGGAGQDAFIFTTRAGHDTVTDFTTSVDKLEFDNLGFTSASEVLGLFHETTAGLTLSLGSTDTLLLAGLDHTGVTVDDIIVHDTVVV